MLQKKTSSFNATRGLHSESADMRAAEQWRCAASRNLLETSGSGGWSLVFSLWLLTVSRLTVRSRLTVSWLLLTISIVIGIHLTTLDNNDGLLIWLNATEAAPAGKTEDEAKSKTDVPLAALMVQSANDRHFRKGRVKGDMNNEKATLVA